MEQEQTVQPQSLVGREAVERLLQELKVKIDAMTGAYALPQFHVNTSDMTLHADAYDFAGAVYSIQDGKLIVSN